jgi:hypothetical protein
MESVMDIRKTQALSDILKDKSLLKDKCYIDGKWLGAAKSIDVTNPVNESVIGSIPFMGKAETKQAIEAAERAQRTGPENAKNVRQSCVNGSPS